MHDASTQELWDWVDLMVVLVIPVLVMITCSALVMIRIMLSRMRRASGSSLNVSRVTAMLVTVYMVYILCVLPYAIFLLYFDTIMTMYGCCYATYVTYVITPALLLVLFTNNAVNFLLYCISGSKFRAELKQMFACEAANISRDTSRTELKPTGSAQNC
jgi:hypothetical protein